MQKKLFLGLVIASAILYIAILYQMLFRFGRGNVMLSEGMQYNYAFNLIPFKTISEYIMAAIDGNIRGHAIRNLIGNLFLLLPLGFYLPFLFKKATALRMYAVVVAAFIVIIEVVQLITMSGSLDIDDFILNFTGAIIGFLICKYTPVRALFKLRTY
jgi:glycopeptide antibiotics resistance protein